MSTQIKTIQAESFSMDYFQFGQGDRALVILPGISLQSVMIFADAVAEAYQPLAEDFTVYVFDRRKDVPADYSIYDMAEDTAEAFRLAGLTRVNLFGTSQGGMIAMVIAIRYPELVEKLALGSASACVKEKRYQTLARWIQMAEEGLTTDLCLAFGEAIYPKEVFEQSKDLLKESAEAVTDKELEQFIIMSKALKGFDILTDLHKISCPVLVIGSRDDRVLGPEGSEDIAGHIGRKEDLVLYLYDDYGHAAYDVAPDYKERLKDFFTD